MTTGQRRADNPPAVDPHEVEFREQLVTALGADYELEDSIGQGGFGRVYRATDRRLGRKVAIKVIRPDFAGARAYMDRFRREARSLAALRHPGIVPIYDIRGGDRDSLVYYVMPMVNGQTLREKLTALGRLPPKETHRVLMELSVSLAHSHKAGIVHRDIKPDNVMLEGLFGRVLLMDFGIAKELGDSNLTGSGLLMGTPTYMSPEQANGDGQVDHRSDIYSIGVLGYQMLTGRPPFEGNAPAQVIAGHMAFEASPIRNENPSVPKRLADAVERCLEKDADKRFQSAMDLFAALQTVRFYGIGDDAQPKTEHAPLPVSGFFAGLCIASMTLLALGPELRLDVDSFVYAAAMILFGLATIATSRALRESLASMRWMPNRVKSLLSPED